MKKSFWSLLILLTLVSLYGCGSSGPGVDGEAAASTEVLSQVTSVDATQQKPELVTTNLTQVQVDPKPELTPVQGNLTEIDPPLVYQVTPNGNVLQINSQGPDTDNNEPKVERKENIIVEYQG